MEIINFTLKNQDNQEVVLSDFLGQYVVLYFYPKDFTPGCTTQACQYQTEISKFNQENIKLFGISADSVERHQKFRDKCHLEFDLLSDNQLQLAKQLGAVHLTRLMAKRKTYVLDPQHRIIEVIDDVDPQKDASRVLDIIAKHRRNE